MPLKVGPLLRPRPAQTAVWPRDRRDSGPSILDIPEGESLGFNNLYDFRLLRRPRHGRHHHPAPTSPARPPAGAYTTTWPEPLKLAPYSAAGVNQAVFHGFCYATPRRQWPGFAAFTPYNGALGYGEAWGPRQPTWGHVPDISGYLSPRPARAAARSQPGRRRQLPFQKGYAGSGLRRAVLADPSPSTASPIGWTHTTISPRLLHFPSAQVRNGRLAPDGPNFKVLILRGRRFLRRPAR